MQDIGAQLATVGIALTVVAGAYLVDLICALANVFRHDEFSWKKLGRGVAKCLLISVGVTGFVFIINLLNWLTTRLNIDVSNILGDVSVVGLLGIVLTSAVKYLSNSYKNIQDFFLKGESSQAGLPSTSPDYQGVLDSAKRFVESVLPPRTLNETQSSKEVEELAAEIGGQGSSDNPLNRRKPDGTWMGQCSRYSYYLATGVELNYSGHPDWGPCNGVDMVNYLCANCGYIRCGKINGAIFAIPGGEYGHTGMVVDKDNNIVNDSNCTPLTVSTHYLNLDASGATYCCPPDMKPIDPPTPADISVGDTVILREWVDYNGTPLYKTRDYYYVSELNGDRAVLRADSMNGPIYCAANTNNLLKTQSSPISSDKPQIGDHVTTSALQDQNGTWLNLKIINDGKSIWTEVNDIGNAVLRTENGTVRCGVPVDSLSKA